MKKFFYSNLRYRVIIIAIVGLLGGCAQQYRPNTYNVDQLGQSQQIFTVEILAVSPITIKNNTGTAGSAAVGALSGAVVGNVIGGDSKGTAIGAVAGGLLGGLVGANRSDKGVLIKYRDHDGAIKTVAQMGTIQEYQLGRATETLFYDEQGRQQVRIMPNLP